MQAPARIPSALAFRDALGNATVNGVATPAEDVKQTRFALIEDDITLCLERTTVFGIASDDCLVGNRRRHCCVWVTRYTRGRERKKRRRNQHASRPVVHQAKRNQAHPFL